MAGIPARVKALIEQYKSGQRPWPEVLNAYEMAAYLRISYWDMVRKINAGEPIPHWREGSKILSRRDELDRYTTNKIRQQMNIAEGRNVRPLDFGK